MRLVDFPLYYTTSEGESKIVYVDASDYVKFKSGEKTLKEAFGHYIDENIINDLEKYEETHKSNPL